MSTTKTALMFLLSFAMVAVGIMHFTRASFFERIVPPILPAPLTIVYVSGVIEILLGLLLLIPQTRVYGAWGLVALFIAVYPANIYHTYLASGIGGKELVISIIRLPFQFLFIAWAYWYTK